jgi:hypothetical protein
VVIGGQLEQVPRAENVFLSVFSVHISRAGVEASGAESKAIPRIQVGLLFKSDFSADNLMLTSVARQAGWDGPLCVAHWGSQGERQRIPIAGDSSRLASLVVSVGGDLVAASSWKDLNNAQLSGDQSWAIYVQSSTSGNQIECGRVKVEMRLDPPFSEIEDGDVGDRGAGFKTAENGHVFCGTCLETGIKDCAACKAEGTITCSTCLGGGDTTCAVCHGSGRVLRAVNAVYGRPAGDVGDVGTQMEGRNLAVCESYSCKNCYGSGLNSCRACNGIAAVRCSVCMGRKQVTCHCVATRRYYNEITQGFG